MFKRPHYIAVALVALLALILFNLPGQSAARLKTAVGSLFAPLFGLSSSAKKIAGKTGDALIPRTVLTAENERLHRENQELQTRLRQQSQILNENTQLRQLFGWQRQNPWKLKLARVVVRDPANWWKTIQINVGSADGVTTNLPVLSSDGFLVGRISAIGSSRSQVLLIGNPNLRVGALVRDGLDKTVETGIIQSSPATPMQGELVDLAYLSRSEVLKPGLMVLTSGDGGVFPKGIPIGNIVDFRNIDFGLSVEARVKLSAKLNSLEEVWVMLPQEIGARPQPSEAKPRATETKRK